MKRDFDIAVIGAGPVGAAAALGLSDLGYEVALVDAGEPRALPVAGDAHDLRVFAVSPASSRLLASVGAWDRIRNARLSPYRHMRVWDAHGSVTFDAADVAASELGHIIENGVIQGALHERIPGTAIDWRSGVRLERLNLEPDGATLGLSGGTRLRARLVVAADGAGSPTRELAGLSVREHPHGQTALVAHVHSERPHNETAYQRFMETGPLALLPLSDGRLSIVWSTTEADAERLRGLDRDGFDRELTLASDGVLGQLSRDTDLVDFPLCSRHAPMYIGERLVLVGDAAHTVHPLAGLGMNLGLRDVRELLSVLERASEFEHDPGERAVLRRYERARKPDNELMLRSLDGINRLFRSELPGVDLMRGWGMKLFDRSGPLKREIIRRAMD
jgi:ubiquinone biosynthesis UbiH/UbiF/VisC/COQ6 family hydroxylase